MARGSGKDLAFAVAERFGFRSFTVRGELVGGELENGASVLLACKWAGEHLCVDVSMVAGPPGTLGSVEAGAMRAAQSMGASALEIKACMVKDSMGRILARNGFTREITGGKPTGNWVKITKLREESR